MFIIVVCVLFVINLVADFPPGESVVDDIRPHHVLWGGGGGGGGGGGEGRGAWQKKNSCNTNVAHGVAPKNISTLA